MEIALGHGKVKVGIVYREERIGVRFEVVEEAHEVGEFTGDDGQTWHPTEQDAIVWLDNVEGGRILQDAVAHALLKLQRVI